MHAGAVQRRNGPTCMAGELLLHEWCRQIALINHMMLELPRGKAIMTEKYKRSWSLTSDRSRNDVIFCAKIRTR